MNKPRIALDNANHHEHEHDGDKMAIKKAMPKAKAMNQKTHKVAAKAHRKSIPR